MIVGNPVRQIADAVMPRPWKFAVPGNGFGRKRRALHQRPVLICARQKRIHHISGVIAIGGLYIAPITSPSVHFNLGKTCTHAAVHSPADRSGMNTSPSRVYRTFIGFHQLCKGCFLFRVFRRRNYSISYLQFRYVHLQNLASPG